MYTSGNTVRCNIDISRGLVFKDKSEVTSIDISLSKRIIKKVNNGTHLGMGTDANGNSYSYTYHTYDTTSNDTIVCRGVSTGMGVKTHIFQIPVDTSNSSSVTYLPDPTSGTLLGQINLDISYGVLVKVKMLKDGEEKELVEFGQFVNKMVTPGSKPIYVHKFFSDFSLMYKSNTSTFSPGEVVNLNVVVMNKTKKSMTSLKTSITGGLGNDFRVSSKKLFFLKTLPFRMNMSQEEEFSYMKNHFHSKCMKYNFKLPETLYGEKDREINVDFIFNGYNLIRSVAVGTEKTLFDLYEVDDLGDEEEQEIEQSDPYMGFPHVPLDKRTLARFQKEEVVRKAKNELIRKRNNVRRERNTVRKDHVISSGIDVEDTDTVCKDQVISSGVKEEDDGDHPVVHFLKNKDIPIYYRVLVNMNDFRKRW